MSGRLRGCSAYERTALADGWEFAAAGPVSAEPASTEAPPEGAPPAGLEWASAVVPGTVAAGLSLSGNWTLDSASRDFDAEEWWFRLRFQAAPPQAGERVLLGFDGLATLAEVWLNGTPLLTSTNMFLEHRCEIGRVLSPRNELVIRFAALQPQLSARRRRPRWRAPMVQHQQLRWIRTSLLGRTPGWSPPAAAVGPWRPIWLERRRLVDLHDLRLRALLVDRDLPTKHGLLHVSCNVGLLEAATLHSAHLVAEFDGRRFESPLSIESSSGRIRGALRIADVATWWPHTHGRPVLYRAHLRLALRDAHGAERTVETDCGGMGFRDVELERTAGDFALKVNGRKIFCRGASWTPLDVIGLQGGAADYRAALAAVRDAGMNMLRISGAMVYESDTFLDLCDEFGILVWQDLMFANMDYPADDQAFHGSVESEVRQQLSRLQARPAVAMLCGNSEGAQQAAMSGAPRECWTPPLFETEFAEWAAEYCPGVPYCASSAHGGAFPHQPGVGVTSYYGVGAYRLPITDARRSEVKFASECLAFANVPDNETLELLARGKPLRCHHPRWKERVPRDQGAGWDFDDIRDHYLAHCYKVDPLSLRYADHDRYLQFGRSVSGEVMAACFAEWRRSRSGCSGALVWFLRDLWPGAGWGVIDSSGRPKAAYYYLKRTLQPVGVFVADEGTNGLVINIINERPAVREVRLELRLFRSSEPVGAAVTRTIALEAASAVELPATDLFDGFLDLSYVFRFGAAPYDVLHARLADPATEAALAEAFYFPQGLARGLEGDLGLSAKAKQLAEDVFELRVQTSRFAQSVHVEAPGFVADDQYFHMAPDTRRTLLLERRGAAAESPFDATLHSLNTVMVSRIVLDP